MTHEDQDGDIRVGVDPETGEVLLQAPCGSVTCLTPEATTELIDALTQALKYAVHWRASIAPNNSTFLS